MIRPPVEAELHAYIGAVCNHLECQAINAGGYTDHVHILCMLSKKIALVKLVEEIKSHSSKWMKTMGIGYENFLLAKWLWSFFGEPCPGGKSNLFY